MNAPADSNTDLGQQGGLVPPAGDAGWDLSNFDDLPLPDDGQLAAAALPRADDAAPERAGGTGLLPDLEPSQLRATGGQAFYVRYVPGPSSADPRPEADSCLVV